MRPPLNPFGGNRLGRRFPLGLFANRREIEDERFNDRLDALHKSVPGNLPQRRFFRH